MPGTFNVTLSQTPIAFKAIEKLRGTEVPVNAPVWASSNTGIVSVLANGIDTASGDVLALGSADITSTDTLLSGKVISDTVTINVVAEEADTLEIQVTIPGV